MLSNIICTGQKQIVSCPLSLRVCFCFVELTAAIFLDLCAAKVLLIMIYSFNALLLIMIYSFTALKTGLALWSCFQFFPTPQSFRGNQLTLTPTVLNCGISQGSALGLFLFALYVTPIGVLFTESCGELYVHNTQLSLAFKTPYLINLRNSLLLFSVFSVRCWMASNKLILDPSRTEFNHLSAGQQIHKFHWLMSVELGELAVPFDSISLISDHFSIT